MQSSIRSEGFPLEECSRKEPMVPQMPKTTRPKLVDVNPQELVDYREDALLPTTYQIDQIARSISEFGFTLPIVNDLDAIVSGSGRVLAARQLGMDKIPTLSLCWMTEQERRLLSIGMIRFARLGNWDAKTLDVDLSVLTEMRLNTLIKINGGFSDARGHMIYPKNYRPG